MSNALTGTDKSVILLMTIGEDRAAEVFKHLSTREVQALSTAMANVRQISNKQLTEVLAEFEQEAEQFAALNINANEYLRSVLVKALGEERASSLLCTSAVTPIPAQKASGFFSTLRLSTVRKRAPKTRITPVRTICVPQTSIATAESRCNRVNTESSTPYRYMFLGSAQIACLMALRLSGLQNVPCRPDKAFTPPAGK